MPEKYSNMNELTTLGFVVNALDPRAQRGDGDTGASFPRSDAEDLSRGARFIPNAVTMARREGECVHFEQPCSNKCCWYWELEDGTREYHWESYDYSRLVENLEWDEAEQRHVVSKGKTARCRLCGDTHVFGGVVPPSKPKKKKVRRGGGGEHCHSDGTIEIWG